MTCKCKLNSSSTLDVSPAMRRYVEEAATVFEPYIDDSASVRCHVKVSGRKKKVKFVISDHDMMVRTEARNIDFYSAVDEAAETARDTSVSYTHLRAHET